MKYLLGLAQTCHPADGNVMRLVERYAKQAAEEGVSLLVFPESLMTRYEIEAASFMDEAQPLDGEFASFVNEIAKLYEIWIAYTLNEKNPNNDKPFNTAVLVDDQGVVRGRYRKIHLFDSSTTSESSRMSFGDAVFAPVETPLGKIGLGICYDLRFPELARKQTLEGCELLLYPAAWVDGPGKTYQWQTLLKARAIENEIFVVGVSRADEGYVGSSLAVAPDGTILAEGSRNKELLVCEIDTDLIEETRSRIPVLEHRHPEAYELRQ